MKILIIGYSDIVKRRVLPSIENIKSIKTFDVASKTGKIQENKKLDSIFKNYDTALKKSDANLVYISLPNSFHYSYSKKALEMNKNVIVDKPAIVKLNQLQILEKLVNQNGLAISMSSVFNHHKCWNKFKILSLKNNEEGTLVVNFSIPKLHKNNIRMSKKLGGGAINDMGIYASNIGSLFWESSIKELSINKTFDKQVDIGFNVMATYGDGKELIGSFGFNKIYKNQVEYHGSMFSTKYERVFSPPPDLDTYITKETNKTSKEYKVGYDDSFTNYLNYVTKKLKNEKQTLNKEFFKKNYEYEKFLK